MWFIIKKINFNVFKEVVDINWGNYNMYKSKYNQYL